MTELTQILAQSQPRVSRHLKLLVEAGLLDRFREGALVFYRLAEQGPAAHLARTLVDLLPGGDAELNRDLGRLQTIREQRAQVANAYFKENAADWHRIRSLYVAEEQVEKRLRAIVGPDRAASFLDIGTGTGRMLQLFAAQIDRGLGIDTSAEMLSVARHALEQANLRHVHVRKGDMYNMPIEDASVDIATLHLVLHYSLEPQLVISEAARTLRGGGRLIIVDFAPHQEEHLRSEHKHQRLGFSTSEIERALEHAGLQSLGHESLAGTPLTVTIWQGLKPAGKSSAHPGHV